jgi:hypothetical protein
VGRVGPRIPALLSQGLSSSYLGLPYARPDLVRRRGIALSHHSIRADNIDATFLAFAINRYLVDPSRRAAIGTHLEYADLLRTAFRPLTPSQHS